MCVRRGSMIASGEAAWSPAERQAWVYVHLLYICIFLLWSELGPSDAERQPWVYVYLLYMYICRVRSLDLISSWLYMYIGYIYILSGICHICVYCLMGNAPLTSFLHTFYTKWHVSPIHCPKHCTLQCFGQWMGGHVSFCVKSVYKRCKCSRALV